MELRKNLIVENFPYRSFGDIIYNLKLSFKMLRRFFWVIYWFRGYDYSYTYMVIKVCLETIKDDLVNDKYTNNQNKIVTLDRCLVLIDNLIKDDYHERCGYDYNYNIEFVKEDDSNGDLFTLVSDATEEQEKNNTRAIKEGNKLEEEERKELFNLIGENITSWCS